MGGDGRTMVLVTFTLFSLVLLSSLSFQEKWGAEAQTHHVVGDDRGWDSSSNVASWANRRIFRVGDFVWFAYSAAEENIVELGSRDEYESCDITNPIKMYTDGLSKVSLDGEGIRYFVSGNPESCKKGLRIPVETKPKSWIDPNPDKSKSTMKNHPSLYSSENDVLAAAPSTPSDATTGRVFNTFGFMLLLLGASCFL